MQRGTERRALRVTPLGVSCAALVAVLVAGLVHASASTLDARATDLVASGTAVVAPACDDDVTARLVFVHDGSVETDHVHGIEVTDVDPQACAGRTVTATAYDAGGAVLLAGSAVLAAGSSGVRLDGLAPVLATSVRTIVVDVA